MGLLILIIGLVVMLGAHVFVTFREHRASLIARLGQGGYRGLFSVVSLIGLRAHRLGLWRIPRA